jgi:hypothetical protein
VKSYNKLPNNKMIRMININNYITINNDEMTRLINIHAQSSHKYSTDTCHSNGIRNKKEMEFRQVEAISRKSRMATRLKMPFLQDVNWDHIS